MTANAFPNIISCAWDQTHDFLLLGQHSNSYVKAGLFKLLINCNMVIV